MATKRLNTQRVNDAHKVIIKNRLFRDSEQNSTTQSMGRIVAHLPETYGFSVGSEIGTPFSGFTTSDNIQRFLSITTGSSAKVGISTQKLYMGPEPSEITLNLRFDAYYSGFHEVVLPCVFLMLHAIGHKEKLTDAIDDVVSKLNIGQNLTNQALQTSISGVEPQSVTDFIEYQKTPGTNDIQFGNVFTIKRAYLSTVNPEFSNILDNQGHPLSATCSVTAEFNKPMTKVRLGKAFEVGSISEENLPNQGSELNNVEADLDNFNPF